MTTLFDWLTIALFAALIVLFLNRSTSSGTPSDSMWHYAPPAVGCAAANYLGNHEQAALGFAVVALVIGYVVYFLKPFRDLRS